MVVKVGINGFGRIGRAFFRIAMKDPGIDLVAINSRTGPDIMSFHLKHDSVYGTYDLSVSHTKDSLIVNGKTIPFYTETDPSQIPWKKHNVDVVVESTGVFRDRKDAAKHLTAGARKVLISAPTANADFDVIKGVNEHLYNPNKHHVISNQSCTTNCLTPIVKVLDDNFGINVGYMMTVHAYTSSQNLLDEPHQRDFRRARAAALNMIPTTTGATEAVGRIIPHLKGKLHGIAIRVPVADGSLLEFVANLKKHTSVEEINNLFLNVSKNELKGILEYSTEPLVSQDIVGNPHSAILDSELTKVMDSTFVKVLAWYDNEWGYSNRLVDVAKIVGKK